MMAISVMPRGTPNISLSMASISTVLYQKKKESQVGFGSDCPYYMAGLEVLTVVGPPPKFLSCL